MLIAYSFPPLLEATAILNGKLTRSLVDEGFRSHIITINPETGVSPADPSLQALLHPENRIHTFPSHSNWRTSRGFFLYHMARKLVPTLGHLPDFHIVDFGKAVRLSESVVNKHQIHLIVSSASPFSSHIVGLTLKKKMGLPWVAYFSDPWVGNVYAKYNAVEQSANGLMERMVVEHANALVFISYEGLDATMRRYPSALRQKAHVVPPCFCEDLYSTSPSQIPSGHLLFRHLGSFYGPRTPLPLFEGIAALKEHSPEIAQRCTFQCIGVAPRQVNLQKRAFGIGEELCFDPPVGYVESLSLMKSADVLVLIDPPHEDYVFLPSKLIDYIGAQRPILGITPLKGPAAPLIREHGGIVVAPTDSYGIADAFAQMWHAHADACPLPSGVFSSRGPDRFTMKSMGIRFAQILERFLN